MKSFMSRPVPFKTLLKKKKNILIETQTIIQMLTVIKHFSIVSKL